MKFIAYEKSCKCLDLIDTEIPVFIPLKQFGIHSSLKKIIINSFEKGGLILSEEELAQQLQKQKMIFLLDGIDEVDESYFKELKKEIIELSKDSSNQFLITTRPQTTPNMNSFTEFELVPLGREEIENVLEEYLSSLKYDFLSKLDNNYLFTEAQNMLILTLMILIYKTDQQIPKTRMKIIQKVVRFIKKWEIQKEKKSAINLSWDIKEIFLKKIAFRIIENSDSGLSLSKTELDKILIDLINELESKRDIPSGVIKDEIIKDLTLTGIISYGGKYLSFWHRAFLNYFASMELAERHSNGDIKLVDFLKNPSMDYIIVGMNLFIDDSTNITKEVISENFNLAVYCVIESKFVHKDIVKDILSKLEQDCYSKLKPIRMNAIDLLSKFNYELTQEIYYSILGKNKYDEVKKFALEEVAKSKSEKARKIIMDLIDWDVGCFPYGGTQSSIVQALSNFGEKEQLIMVEIWKQKPDMFTNQSCERAFLKLIDEKRLTKNAENALFDFYSNKEDKSHKMHSLTEVLMRIGNDERVPELISLFGNMNFQRQSFTMYNEDLLASYHSENVTKQLIENSTNKSLDKSIREGCSGALSRSTQIAPLSYFKKLLKDENSVIRRNAIRGLARFDISEIREVLLDNINDEDGRVQHEILEILGDKGIILELLENGNFPKRVVTDTLFYQIRKYKLLEFLPVLKKFEERNSNVDRFHLNIARTYISLNMMDEAKKIIEKTFSVDIRQIDKYCFSDLAELAPEFEVDYAVDLIKRILNSIRQMDDTSGYFESNCVEALEKINDENALTLLKEIAIDQGKKKKIVRIERTFRAMNQLASEKDEDWYLKFIEDNPSLEQNDLRRVVEGLAVVGSKKSIDVVKKIATKYKSNEWIVENCYYVINRLHLKFGLKRDVDEKDLFKD